MQHIIDQFDAYQRDFEVASRAGDHEAMNELGRAWHDYARKTPGAYDLAEREAKGE